MTLNDVPPPTPNPTSFEEFYRHAHPRVVASLALTLGDVEVAGDAAADAFTKAFSDWHRVARLGSPIGWTYTVAINSARRCATRRSKERALLARQPVIGSCDLPEPAFDVWEQLRRLPERQRLAVVLRHCADLTEVEIASVMGVRRSTVSSTLAAAHAALGRLLEPSVAEPVQPR